MLSRQRTIYIQSNTPEGFVLGRPIPFLLVKTNDYIQEINPRQYIRGPRLNAGLPLGFGGPGPVR